MKRIQTGLFAAFAATACTELVTIEPNACGNGVLEEGEDCDGFVEDPATACGDPNSVNACRFVCGVQGGGAACPTGLGCGQDGACRAATGSFTPAVSSGDFLGPSTQLKIGDVDGDGHPDLVAFTLRGLSVRFGQGDGRFVDEFEFPVQLTGGQADLADVDLDGRDDAVLPLESGALVLLGQPDRVLVPAPFLTTLSDTPASRVFPSVAPAEPDAPSVFAFIGPCTPTADDPRPCPNEAWTRYGLFKENGAATGTALPIPFGQSFPGFQQRFATSTNELWAVVGFTGQNTLGLFQVGVAEDCVAPCWAEQSITVRVLEPPASLADAALTTIRSRTPPASGEWAPEPALHLADVTGDAQDDVIALYERSSGVREVVVWASPAFDQPFIARAAEDRLAIPLKAREWPLAFGDFDGDGQPDQVTTKGVWSSLRNDYVAVAALDDWTEAVIEDLNRDGSLDIAAASIFVEGVDVFVGTGAFFPGGSALLNRSRLDTSAAIQRLAAGDFNGDFVTDLLFAERTFEDVEGEETTLFLAPGKLQGPPGPTVEVGRLAFIQDLQPTLFLGASEPNLIEDVLVQSSDRPDGQGPPQLAFLEGSTDGRLVAFIGNLIEGEAQQSYTVRAGALREVASGPTDLLVGRQTRTTEDASGRATTLSLVAGDGTGVFSSDGFEDLEFSECEVGFDLRTSSILVEKLRDTDTADSLFLIDKPVCFEQDCSASLLIRQQNTDDGGCWWTSLVGPRGGVPADLEVADLDGNGVREVIVAYGFDASPLRNSVFANLGAAARETGLGIYWDLDPSAYAGSSGSVEGVDAFAGGVESYGPGVSPVGEDAAAPGADGLGEASQMNGVRSLSLIQADAEPDTEVAMLSSEGLFLVKLDRPGLRFTPVHSVTIDNSLEAMNVESADLDGDGVDDLVVTQGDRFEVFLGVAERGPRP